MAWMPVSPWKLIPGTAQKVAIGAASTSSTAIGANTHAVLVTVTSDCHIRIAPNSATAVAADMLIKAAWPPIVLGVTPGDVVANIQDAAGGFLFLQELSH